MTYTIPVTRPFFTVVETERFSRRVIDSGLSDDDRQKLVDHLAASPQSGAIIPGTGGVRKLRWAAKGKGKRGGVRVIYYFAGEDIPLFLLTVYGKGDKANLTQAERNQIRKRLPVLVRAYRQSLKERAKRVENR
jgi:hypothetical protein